MKKNGRIASDFHATILQLSDSRHKVFEFNFFAKDMINSHHNNKIIYKI